MMSETTNEDRMYPIEMTLQGARCCISIGKGVIKALGKPSHVSIKISDSHDSLSVFPCDEDDVMAFRVPLKLFTDHRCVMRINSKQFVHGIMRTNQMDTSKTYVLSGEFLEEKNTAVFSLVEAFKACIHTFLIIRNCCVDCFDRCIDICRVCFDFKG